MKNLNSKKAHSYLQTNHGDLRQVFTKIKQLNELNRKLATFLDSHLAPYCQVANLVAHRLIIIVANSSIATQLRFQATDLIRKFRQDPSLPTIQDILCKVRLSSIPPHLQQSNKGKPSMQPLSPQSAAIIREIANSIQDPRLQTALKKIAEHTAKKYHGREIDE